MAIVIWTRSADTFRGILRRSDSTLENTAVSRMGMYLIAYVPFFNKKKSYAPIFGSLQLNTRRAWHCTVGKANELKFTYYFTFWDVFL